MHLVTALYSLGSLCTMMEVEKLTASRINCRTVYRYAELFSVWIFMDFKN